MTTRWTDKMEGRARPFSADFSVAVGERRLLKLVLEAVQGVADDSSLSHGLDRAARLCPRMMLTLVTYCYASCLHGSRDIEAAVVTDPVVRYICARTYPDWHSIRRFRRQHRELVQRALASVMKQVWAVQLDDGVADYVGYEWVETALPGEIQAAVNERLDTAALMDGADS